MRLTVRVGCRISRTGSWRLPLHDSTRGAGVPAPPRSGPPGKKTHRCARSRHVESVASKVPELIRPLTMDRMLSWIDHVRADAHLFSNVLIELLAKSGIHLEQRQPFNTYEWTSLDPAGELLQTRALRALEVLHARLEPFYEDLPPKQFQRFHDDFTAVKCCVEQVETRHSDVQSSKAVSLQALARMVAVVTEHPRTPLSGLVVVPDSNVLINYPELHRWKLAQSDQPFVIVLVPQVSQEIDKLTKDHYRDVKAAAVKVRNQITKSLRTRGDLCEGVTVVKGRSEFRLWPLWPAKSYGRLDLDYADDRVLSSAMDLMIAFPSTPVAVATEDLMMTTRAESADIALVDVELDSDGPHVPTETPP